MKLVEHKLHKGMFYLQWPDGSMSDDFYNKSWANHHRCVLQERIDHGSMDAEPRKPIRKFK